MLSDLRIRIFRGISEQVPAGLLMLDNNLRKWYILQEMLPLMAGLWVASLWSTESLGAGELVLPGSQCPRQDLEAKTKHESNQGA